MSAFPSLPLFTDAFLADTGHLTASQTGAYMLLLMMAWRSPGCRLPDDNRKLAAWARMSARNWRRVKPVVMAFWHLDDGCWTQKRLLKEWHYTAERAERARQNAGQNGRDADKMPLQCGGKTPTRNASKSLTNNNVPRARARVPNPNPINKEARGRARDEETRAPLADGASSETWEFAGQQTVRVYRNDPRWPALCARYEQEKGRAIKHADKWPFPKSWVRPQ